MSNKPEALMKLADAYANAASSYQLESLYGTSKSYTAEKLKEQNEAHAALAAELRSQHELIAEMRDVLEKAMPMLALLFLGGSNEADDVGVTMGKLIAKAEAQS